ncbi:hypothetical protein LshimejAT787_1600920 [Lyophyllum shimeji]|uniref:Uncharacterized protein n=1 Tax=Lyophyllum shimeji TaxID=47721 RepID=A0A9P3PZM5_LYOSH|nr:hypothetical protein LshimejAT787_1600920 [Lyophyllum shimeji]
MYSSWSWDEAISSWIAIAPHLVFLRTAGAPSHSRALWRKPCDTRTRRLSPPLCGTQTSRFEQLNVWTSLILLHPPNDLLVPDMRAGIRTKSYHTTTGSKFPVRSFALLHSQISRAETTLKSQEMINVLTEVRKDLL